MEPEIATDRFEIFASGLDHPECCAFDREGYLWAGGEAGQIYRIDASGKVETIANVGGFCCGVARTPDDSELFVCVSGIGIVRVSRNGEHRTFATHAGEHAIVAPNFLLFDSLGRLIVTDSGNWMKGNGFILRFTPDGQGRVLAGPFGYANGLALTADERHLFLVESDSESILKFSVDSNGSLGTPERFAEEVGRFPDGVTLDEAGNIYVCCYASDEIWRIDPQGRKLLVAHDHWGIRLGRPTNLTFGGPNFDEAYVANLGRTTISRAGLETRGQPPANLRGWT